MESIEGEGEKGVVLNEGKGTIVGVGRGCRLGSRRIGRGCRRGWRKGIGSFGRSRVVGIDRVGIGRVEIDRVCRGCWLAVRIVVVSGLGWRMCLGRTDFVVSQTHIGSVRVSCMTIVDWLNYFLVDLNCHMRCLCWHHFRFRLLRQLCCSLMVVVIAGRGRISWLDSWLMRAGVLGGWGWFSVMEGSLILYLLLYTSIEFIS